MKQDDCSLAPEDSSFLDTLQGARAWSGSKEQTVAVGHGPDQKSLCPPCLSAPLSAEAGRAQAGQHL